MYTKGRRTKGSRDQRIKDASFNKLPFKNRHPQKISTNYTCKSRDKTIEAQYDRFCSANFFNFVSLGPQCLVGGPENSGEHGKHGKKQEKRDWLG